MNAINTVLGVIIVAVLGVVGVAATQPDVMNVSRSATFNVAPQAVFAQINDLHKWQAWSPWAKLDPKSVPTFAGPEKGAGSSMVWYSENPEVGVGKMTITESVPNQRIVMLLEFEKPMKGTNTTVFTFAGKGKTTEVTWSMSGPMGLLQKVMSLAFNCEKMVGGMFEQGLNNLKAVVEK